MVRQRLDSVVRGPGFPEEHSLYVHAHTHSARAGAFLTHTLTHTGASFSEQGHRIRLCRYSPLMMFVYAYAHTCTHTKSYRGSNLFRLSRLSEVQGQMFPDFLSVAEGALPKHGVSCTRPTQRDCLPSLIRNWCVRPRVWVGQ